MQIKKPANKLAGLKLGRKDSNLRNAWTKTRCLTTWRRPINGEQIYNIMSKMSCQILFADFTSFNTEVTAYINLFATSSMYS